jgi:hypothetical protein
MTQGESLVDLRENLKDLFHDLTSGETLWTQKVAELTIP